MPNPVVECVPNYSEARRPEVVEAIMATITSVSGVRLLDRHSDLDHNRTVLTFVGSPDRVEEAAFRSIAKAAELINLDQHTGEHPRIGATDVVPFIPISSITMQECVEIARRLGRRVGDELGIPVYLYEQAATCPERQNLENIRRGQYEALKVEMGVVLDRKPDFGPEQVGTAGATVIGARYFLIAYNVYLTTNDVSIAKKIAKAIRQSSGGLRYVKALGLTVEGYAQVSMNLTNYRETPMARVVEMIRREAERYGVGIHHSELVGLIPQEALVDAAVWYLQMDQFKPDQILESRLYAEAQVEESSKYAFLDQLAAGTPTPGGGAAAAYTGAAAAALVSMVSQLTIGKKKYAEVEDHMKAIFAQAEILRSELTAIIERDSTAFEAVLAAYKLPKDTIEQQLARSQAIELATVGATQEPLQVAHKVVQIIELALMTMQEGNLNAITDAGTGAALAYAALNGASLNVRINAASLQNKETARQFLGQLGELEARATELNAQMRSVLAKRGGLTLP